MTLLAKYITLLIKEAISPEVRRQLEVSSPEDILTVYHGTPLFRLPDLINGFDATGEHTRAYGGPRHSGLFVTPDMEVAKGFGGGAVIEIKVPAKFIHGTNWNGTTDRDLERQGKDLSWVYRRYPGSFRPGMTDSMLSAGEPQGLLLGVVKPSQISRVWVLKDQAWTGFSREEFLKQQQIYNVEYGQEKKFANADIDLADPNLDLYDYLAAYSKAQNVSEERALAAILRLFRIAPEKLRVDLRYGWDIGGSRLGRLALRSIWAQIEKLNKTQGDI